MAKDLKIKDEQLVELQGLVQKINNAQMNLGQIEACLLYTSDAADE